MPNIVDGTVEPGGGSTRRGEPARSERYDRSMAIAAIVQAIPLFVWAAPLVLIFGFLILALFYQRGHLEDFTGGVLIWLSRLLIAGGVVLGLVGAWKCYKLYHAFMLDAAARRTARAGVTKALAAARAQELKNEQLEVKIELEKQLPYVLRWAVENGYPVRYGKDGLEIAHQLPGVRGSPVGAGATPAGLLSSGDGLPEKVLYEDVRDKVPQGHVLVGVGLRGLIETVERAVGALVWIVGLSGTGKTSTTVLRVEERAAVGHSFLGVDPHFFKGDSLTNAVKMYAGRFLKPMARTPEETNQVFTLFLNEFYGRKNGTIPKPWKPITLIVDEVGALADAIDELEKENLDLLKRIARICGQEARDFLMGAIAISQQATGLAWLRKVALMVVVHQLLMNSEKELACNGDKAVMKDMEHWPIGRTYVFGVGFGAGGARVVQQPYFAGRVVGPVRFYP